jgi:hypothetical protein
MIARRGRAVLFLALPLLFVIVPFGHSQPSSSGPRVVPKLEPVAETKLLMEGMAHANFRGLDRILNQKPADNQPWVFARGQALLIAETGNLLMLRPPKNQGQPVWFERAMELRKTASQLAETLAKRDYDASRRGLVDLANSCNRCHQTFRIPVEISPFVEEPAPKKAQLEP